LRVKKRIVGKAIGFVRCLISMKNHGQDEGAGTD